MKKDSVTDYATAAFALFAKHGRRGEEDLREYIYQRELLAHENPEVAVVRAEAAVSRSAALLSDVAAVEKTLDLLRRCGEPERFKAVEAVYVSNAGSTNRHIAARVRVVARQIPATERTVYRWLKEARVIFAEFRGLHNS